MIEIEKKYPIGNILLLNSSIAISKPFSLDTLNKTEVIVSLQYGHITGKIKPMLPLKIGIEVKIIDKESKAEHVSIKIEYILNLKNENAELTAAFLKDKIMPYAFSVIWPYFRYDIDSYLSRAGYHPLNLQPLNQL